MAATDAYSLYSGYDRNRSGGGAFAPSDLATLLWRQRWLMAAAFIVIFAAGMAFAFTQKTTYPAYASIAVRVGQEYVYQPRVGELGAGAVPNLDQVMVTEERILASDIVRERVVRRIGARVMYPKLPDNSDASVAKAVQAMGKALQTEPSAAGGVIRISFDHADALMAARALNLLIDEYQVRRREALIDSDAPVLDTQRQAFEEKATAADSAYQAFLTLNGIGDFETERTSLNQSQADLARQALDYDRQLRESRAELATARRLLASEPRETVAFRDPSAKARQLDELRARRDSDPIYLPGSKEMQVINEQIASLQADLVREGGQGPPRTSANPNYQALQADVNRLSAKTDSLESALDRIRELQKQNTVDQRRLAELEPEHRALAQEREILQTQARAFAVRAQESQADQAVARQGADNISVLEPAGVPTQGKSNKKIVAALALVMASFTALCLGLIGAFLRMGTPTPRLASRTLDLPVLAQAPLKR